MVDGVEVRREGGCVVTLNGEDLVFMTFVSMLFQWWPLLPSPVKRKIPLSLADEEVADGEDQKESAYKNGHQSSSILFPVPDKSLRGATP